MTYLFEVIDGLFWTLRELIWDLADRFAGDPILLIVVFGLPIIGAVFGYTQRLIKGR